MERRLRSLPFTALIICVIAVAAGGGWYLAERSAKTPSYGAAPPRIETSGAQKRVVHLYFGDKHGRFLTAEQRIMDQTDGAVLAGRQLVEALGLGPEQGGSRTLPPDARVRSFFITEDRKAYLDFEAGAFDHHPGGVAAELLSIYSIVNTLVLNVETIRSVKILLGGQEAATLAGHVDLRHTFQADMRWVR